MESNHTQPSPKPIELPPPAKIRPPMTQNAG